MVVIIIIFEYYDCDINVHIQYMCRKSYKSYILLINLYALFKFLCHCFNLWSSIEQSLTLK